MNVKEFSIQPRAYDILEAKKNSENPEKFFDEATDNSIQYGAENITVEINEECNSVLTTDDGFGFVNFEAFRAFHQPYHVPIQMGISKYGIGGKIFKTLSDKRIVFSVGRCPVNRDEKKGYFSFWDTSTPESTDRPVIYCFDLGERVPMEVNNILHKYDLVCQLNNAISSGTTGTTVCLVEVDTERVRNFFRNWSKMTKKVKRSFFERYHLLIAESGTNITVRYINNKGNSDSPVTVEGYDPRDNLNKTLTGKRPLNRSLGATQICSWVKKIPVERLSSRGIHFYRDDIKIATIPFVKRHGNNVNDFTNLDTNTKMYRMNLEGQMILIRNNSDAKFNLGETKDKITLPVKVGLAAAVEMETIIKIVEQYRKKQADKTISSGSKTVKIGTPSVQMELETPQSFIKTDKGIEIVHGSTLHELLSSSDKIAKDIIVNLFECFDIIYNEKATAADRSALTRVLNRTGQLLETKL